MHFSQFLAILASNYPDRISCNIKESILWQGGTTMSARKVITSVLAVGTTIAIAIDGYLLFLKADQASSTASTASSSTSTATSSSASSASSSSSSASSSTSSGLVKRRDLQRQIRQQPVGRCPSPDQGQRGKNHHG